MIHPIDRPNSDVALVRLRIGLLATSINHTREWCQWKSELCRSAVRKKLHYSINLYSVARSRAQIYSPVRPRFTPEGDEDRSAHRSTDNVSLRKTLAESQLGRGGYGARRTGSRSSLLNSRSSLTNAKSGSRLVSANSLLSGSRTPSRLTVPTSSRHSVVSEEGYSVRAFNRLSLREHGWRQSGPTAPFLHSEEPLSNAEFGGRLLPLKPITSRSCSLGRQTISSR